MGARSFSCPEGLAERRLQALARAVPGTAASGGTLRRTPGSRSREIAPGIWRTKTLDGSLVDFVATALSPDEAAHACACPAAEIPETTCRPAGTPEPPSTRGIAQIGFQAMEGISMTVVRVAWSGLASLMPEVVTPLVVDLASALWCAELVAA